MNKKNKNKISSFIVKDKHVLNGVPCFKGSRVPIYVILDHISAGWEINGLMKAFPTVKKEYISSLIKYYSDKFFLNEKDKAGNYCF